MSNYADLEYEFIDRTRALIEQYEVQKKQYKFEEQYNHTLLINCLLGLIVLPKEKTITFIPNDRLTIELRKEIGLPKSHINESIISLRQLIIALRHSVAHFNIKVESLDEKFLIDEIVFQKENGEEIVRFLSEELLPFVRYYSSWLLSNLKKYREQNRT